MKLTGMLLAVLFFQVNEGAFSQTITWSGKNVPVEKVLLVIKKQTGYFTFYNSELLKGSHKITLNVKNAPLKDVLDQCIKNQPFDYVIENKTIVLTKRIISVKVLTVQSDEKKDSMRTVSGTVSNEKGEPLEGATVAVATTTLAAAAAADGRFILRVPVSKHELIISSIGFEEGRVTIKNLNDIVVVLRKRDLVEASDVIIVGYGSTKKTDVTGSVSQINITDIRDRQNPDLPTLLQGKVSGLDVNAGSIRIRGVTSFNITDPLVVVDGFLGGNVETLNPNDIERIDVLKDASSTAIYGARGSNGVILVTTKRPKVGPTKIAVSINSGFAFTPKKLDVLNATQYIDFVQESLRNAGQAQAIPANLLTDAVRITATDWQNEVFKTAHSNAVDMSFSGGSPNATFYVSMGYKHEDEIFIGPVHDALTARFKNEFKVKSWLRFGDNLALVYKINRGAGPSFVSSMINMPPYKQVRDTANYWGFSSLDRVADASDAINPVSSSALTHPVYHSLDYLANIWMELEPFKGLQYHMQYGAIGSFSRYSLWTDRYNNNAGQTIDNTFSDNSTYALNPVWESYLTYSLKFGKHDFSLMAGNSRQNVSAAGSISIYGQNYANPGVRTVFNAATRSITGETISKYAFESYFGRLNYQYDSRYLLTVNIRRDGSPRFAPVHRWGTFPSVAFAWKMQESNFIKELNLFNQLKFRASLGVAGNDAIGDFRYLSQIFTNGVYYVFGTNPSPVSGATIVADASQNIKWESTTSKALALDMSFLRNSLNITAEYFMKVSKDILFPVPRPQSLGYGLGVTGGDAIVNAAGCVNRGIELQLGFRNHIGKLYYAIDANYTHVNNKVTSLGTNQRYMEEVSRTEINKPIGYFYGYVADGVFKTMAELEASNQSARTAALKANPGMSSEQVSKVYYQLASTSAGDVRFKDLNGDGIVSADGDRRMIGSSIPSNFYGLTAQLNYGTFDLNLFFHAVTGSQVYYSAYEQTRSMKAIQNQESYVLNRWKSEQEPGNGIVPRAVIGDPAGNSRPSSLMISNGNYLKLRQASFGYSIPDKMLSRMGFTKLRIYASGSNLLTITKADGYDPEFGGTNLKRGVNFLAYPMARSFSLGVQFGL